VIVAIFCRVGTLLTQATSSATDSYSAKVTFIEKLDMGRFWRQLHVQGLRTSFQGPQILSQTHVNAPGDLHVSHLLQYPESSEPLEETHEECAWNSTVKQPCSTWDAKCCIVIIIVMNYAK
jgi:hypothetical protein